MPYAHRTPPAFGYTDSVYWLRFRVTNATANEHWVLEIAYPPLDELDVYIFGPEGCCNRVADKSPAETVTATGPSPVRTE